MFFVPGFYDDQLEWLALERVQIVSQMNPSSTVGRYGLSTRFTAITRIAYIGYPDKLQLNQVFHHFGPVLPGEESRVLSFKVVSEK